VLCHIIQNIAHKKRPGLQTIEINWFNLPGTASTFNPNSGTDHACKTSIELIINLIVVAVGTIKELSTDNNLLFPIFKSYSCKKILSKLYEIKEPLLLLLIKLSTS